MKIRMRQINLYKIEPSPRAILTVEWADALYAVAYGLAYFAVDKFCDSDFAERVEFKEIKSRE